VRDQFPKSSHQAALSPCGTYPARHSLAPIWRITPLQRLNTERLKKTMAKKAKDWTKAGDREEFDIPFMKHPVTGKPYKAPEGVKGFPNSVGQLDKQLGTSVNSKGKGLVGNDDGTA
jgi:hypothetical protein